MVTSQPSLFLLNMGMGNKQYTNDMVWPDGNYKEGGFAKVGYNRRIGAKCLIKVI